ncbi:MAG TPA: uracil-DNA glycosylase [Phycisphaerales bacterium]|nr:uracil-DNA glycosylase [Phycisphaerales bacterium]
MMTDESRIRKIVAQHAYTAQLMGVDFLPLAQRAETPGGGAALPAEFETAFTPVQRATHDEDGFLGVPSKAKTSVAAKTPMLVGDELDWSPPKRRSGEDERAYRRRCLDALREKYEEDAPHKQFVTAHTHIVFGDGDPCARVTFVGEAPGEEEDRTGTPFVGRAGQLLNKQIAAMGLSREEVYICNVLKTRPPGNATPTSREVDLCRPYLLAQLAIVRPEAVVTLGIPATRALLRTEESMAKMRGKWGSVKVAEGVSLPVLPTYHPAYLLRNYTDAARKMVWEDLQVVMNKLGLKRPAGKGMA